MWVWEKSKVAATYKQPERKDITGVRTTPRLALHTALPSMLVSPLQTTDGVAQASDAAVLLSSAAPAFEQKQGAFSITLCVVASPCVRERGAQSARSVS